MYQNFSLHLEKLPILFPQWVTMENNCGISLLNSDDNFNWRFWFEKSFVNWQQPWKKYTFPQGGHIAFFQISMNVCTSGVHCPLTKGRLPVVFQVQIKVMQSIIEIIYKINYLLNYHLPLIVSVLFTEYKGKIQLKIHNKMQLMADHL